MSQPPPPPPPPHGENPRTTAGGSGLPPGKYDVFIIPEHSAGSGFLYLPSLKPQWNSFAAGVVSTLAVGAIVNLASPVVVRLLSGPDRSWSLLWATVVACVGVAAFLLGRHQNESSGQQNGEGSGPRGYQRPGGGYDGSRSWYTPPPHNGPPPNQAPPPPPPPPPPPQNDAPRDGGGPYQSWQDQPRPQPQPEPQAQPQPPPEPQREKPQPKPDAQPQSPPPPQPSATKTETPKGAWEKAREEMRRREEERKAKEAEAKRKEESARRLRELREKEAKERERREKEAREREALKEKLRQEQEARERERLEKELREKLEREMREKAEKEAKEREARLKEEARKREEERARAEKERQAAREREAREARERREREERAARLRKEEEEKEKNARKGSTYAFSSVGEKTSMWPNGKPPNPAPSATSAPSTPKPASPAPPSPTKPSSPTKPAPSTTTTTTTTGTGDGYSFRPYDQPKKPTARKKSVSDFSESSWAPSASTARTTPPPSTRGPYTTSDPQKIIIRAVYGYLNQFSKTPASQLVSGVPPVTDGLILRVTSAGLFVDDDVRGVAQREWDVKAWTLKLVEVWCPVHAVHAAAATPGSVPTNHPFFKTMPASARRGAERGATKTLLGEEAVAYIDEFGRVCDGACRRGRGAASASGSSEEWKGRGLHLLRATIRDQEGKRFVFVVGEDEAWKIAGGLAALRGSSQVRALGVAGFSSMEARTLLDSLGWGA